MNHTIKNDISHYVSAENVEKIRERLEGVLAHFKLNLTKVSHMIHVSPVTLCKFIRDREEISFVELLRVEDFVIEMEHDVKESFK